MSPLFNYLLIPLLVAVFLGLNMGGSGTGPSFSVAYGSNIIRPSLIPGLFGIMVFLGAILAGKATATILLIASVTRGIPTSLVQLNTAGIIGIGVAKLGYKNIFKKTEVNRFFLVWLIAPVIAFLLSLFLTFLFDR